MNNQIRVLIADANEGFTAQLSGFLGENSAFVVAGVANDGEKAVELLHTVQADLLILDLLLLASLLLENRRPAAAAAAVSVLLVLTGVLSLAKGYGLPRYSEVWDNEVQQVQAALEKSQAAVNSEDPWDHTAAYAFLDEVHCGLLYGVPDGMGIQFDENSYLEDAANPVYARYVFTSAGSNTAARLTADGWSVLYESEKCVLYERTR